MVNLRRSGWLRSSDGQGQGQGGGAPGECPKGRGNGLGSLARRKRRYEDLSASTSREPMIMASSSNGLRVEDSLSETRLLPVPLEIALHIREHIAHQTSICKSGREGFKETYVDDLVAPVIKENYGKEDKGCVEKLKKLYHDHNLKVEIGVSDCYLGLVKVSGLSNSLGRAAQP
ncbi:hypothetical protein Syun_018665 [Stephania yunnanensis]|uniref:Uncharacterized protein n=1 Tax=Stephania yunnanensis TaxID=152371 RepID=A0AAP0ISN1_9MAGN